MRAAVLLALAACGDNSAPDPNVVQSGSRLHLVQYDYGDGARQIDTARFHDAARDERCAPLRWSDGDTYCTPAYATTVFTSADCSEAVGQVAASGPDPDYLLQEFWLAGVFLPSRLYERGAPIAAPAATWLRRGSACDGPYANPNASYFALGPEVSKDELVRITHPDVPSASRLQRQVLASADGLYLPVALHDGEVPCTAAWAPGAATAPCVPADARIAEYFHDATCTEPELAIAVPDSVPSTIEHVDERTSCSSYYELGAEVEAPPLFYGPSCDSIAAPSDRRYFVAGPPADLVMLDRERDPVPRRIHPITLAAGDVRLGDANVYDEVLGTECRRAIVADAWRCLPVTSTVVTERFGSDACQTVVPLAEIHTSACATRDAFALDKESAFRRIGAVHTAPVFHLSTGDRCLPYTAAEGIELRDVGPALPLDAFATATVVTEDP